MKTEICSVNDSISHFAELSCFTRLLIVDWWSSSSGDFGELSEAEVVLRLRSNGVTTSSIFPDFVKQGSNGAALTFNSSYFRIARSSLLVSMSEIVGPVASSSLSSMFSMIRVLHLPSKLIIWSFANCNSTLVCLSSAFLSVSYGLTN